MLKIITTLLAIILLQSCHAQEDSLAKKNIASDSVKAILTDSVQRLSVTDSFPDTTQLQLAGKVVSGIASFYSDKLNGGRTATGVVFSNRKFTGASNSFKLNTWVKVTNLRNNKTVVVIINDRMGRKMAKRGRVIDVSRIAAEQLDFVRNGLTKVKVEALEPVAEKKRMQ